MSEVSRRDFVILSGTAAGAAAAAELLMPLVGAQAVAPDAAVVLVPDYVARIRRPADQCVLTLQFFNVKPDFTHSPPVLTKIDPAKQNYLVVHFGPAVYEAPQHVAEHAFPLDTGNLQKYSQKKPVPATESVGSKPIAARIAGPSRLAFHLPDNILGASAAHPLLLDTAHLLNWVGLNLSVAANAVPPFKRGLGQLAPTGIGAPARPTALQTAIELPTGLVVSPPGSPSFPLTNQEATIFVNATGPVTHHGWTELWHTRLAVRRLIFHGQLGAVGIDENSRELRTIRALWAQDPKFAADLAANSTSADGGLLPFRTSLSYQDRYDIVRLSSDFSVSSTEGGPYGRTGPGQNGLGYVPAPATVDLMMLTALGGWLDCDAHWDLPAAAGRPSDRKKSRYYNSSLLSWRHRAVQGRDSYVRVVRKGYLFPWGHRASLITVTEREPTPIGSTTGAYLRQKVFIVVGEPVKSYGQAGDFAPHGGLKLPFTSVEALTLITPDLKVPTKVYSTKQGGKPELVFEPTLDGKHPFQFHFRGTDWAGDPIDFRSPVLWVDDLVAYGTVDTGLMKDVRSIWSKNRPTIALHNQRVSVAQPKAPDTAKGDTQIVASSFTLGAEPPRTGTTGGQLILASQPDFYPTLYSVAVNMPEAKTASGNAVAASTLEFEPTHYLAGGFGAGNPGGVFLSRLPTATKRAITFQGDKSGGAVTPNLAIDGISRLIGPASGNINALALGAYNPGQVFANVNAKLLGGLELQAILSNVSFDADDTTKVLTLTSVELQNPHRIVTTLDWHPQIKNGGPTIGGHTIEIFELQGGVTTSVDSMDLHAVIVTDLVHPANSSTHVYGQIRSFNINLFGNQDPLYFIQIPFDSLTFHAQSGKKTDVDVQISDGGVQFVGPLSFVQQLAAYLAFDGSGLVIDTSGAAITAKLTLAIPSIGVGVFALENLAFSAGVAIPYNGDPVRFDFAFCSRENPFQLSIMIFTGGGFVGLGIGADGVELLEFSFDFGLGVSIDIGIASGQISLVGGVYYESEKQTNGTQDVQLTAYIKASGGISALGLVSVSVELYLALNYYDKGGHTSLSGDATMTISVHVLFFGGSVSISMHKEFAGSSASNGAAVHAHDRKAVAGADGPPVNSFGAAMSLADWEAYCTSFALLDVGV